MKKKLINVHTHVFTGNYVPPYLAKTIIPWPFYFLINTGWIVSLFKRYYSIKYKKEFGNAKTEDEKAKLWSAIFAKRRKDRRKVNTRFFISSRWYLSIPLKIIFTWLSVVGALFIIDFVVGLGNIKANYLDTIVSIKQWLSDHHLFFDLQPIFKIVWILGVLFYIKISRQIIFFILKNILPIIKKLINKNALELLGRYYQIGRFALYGTQHRVALRALHQLPANSAIVMLPMDMEFMGAGKSKPGREFLKAKSDLLSKGWTNEDFADSYKLQMRELWEFVKHSDEKKPKSEYYPFVFLDPRRIATEGKSFFDYDIVNDRMELKPCFIKTYIEQRNFSGFKIYPALGYYPFDEHLLPIWRYAVENNIPIMAHCVVGVIYYRGSKKKEWNYHPIFQEETAPKKYEPMLLPEAKSKDFQINFTHPMNYLCLLEEDLFKQVLKSLAPNSEVRKLFGYNEEENTVKFNLSKLKFCLAHFGGAEEWTRYMEQDRVNSSQRLMRNPKEAINFMHNAKGNFSWYKLSDLWKNGDWYSIICSMMIDYKNVYADLSYIISNPSIYPLLKYTLEKGEDYENEHQNYLQEPSPNKKALHYTGKNKLRSRVLFGTDFYVVRNHNSDKELFVETKALLTEEEFDLIARENTHNYLSNE